MANQIKISDLTALGGNPAENDLLLLVDTSENVTKKMTISDIIGIVFPEPYIKTMIGNETFSTVHSLQRTGVYILDPGGSNRNFDPSGTFPIGFKAEIINTGDEIITFDSSVSTQIIIPGARTTFIYDGTIWRGETMDCVTKPFSIKLDNIGTTSINVPFGFVSRVVVIETDPGNSDEIAIDWFGGTAEVPAENTEGNELQLGGRINIQNFITSSISVIAVSGIQTVRVRAYK